MKKTENIRQHFKPKHDLYWRSRGKHRARFLNIYCEHCFNHVLLYQKDDPGDLKRLYLDRIVAPQKYVTFKPLVCSHCKRLIAIPSVYKEEKRKCLLCLSFAFIKQVTKGVYPPERMKYE